MDDGIRERHGIGAWYVPGKEEVDLTLVERDQTIELPSCVYTRRISPTQARYLARKLYRLARRIDKRNDL